MKIIVQQKLKAAAIHFAASVCVVVLAALLCAFLWFPSWVYKNDVLQGFTLIAVVDVVLGPLLTLVVYNAAKASLKYDLGVIVLVQLAALVYGLSAVYSQRPLVQILYFEGVAALRAEDINGASELPATTNINGVPTYFLDLPPKRESYEGLKFTYDLMGENIAANADLYKPIDELTGPLAELYLLEANFNSNKSCYELPFQFRASSASYCFEFARNLKNKAKK